MVECGVEYDSYAKTHMVAVALDRWSPIQVPLYMANKYIFELKKP